MEKSHLLRTQLLLYQTTHPSLPLSQSNMNSTQNLQLRAVIKYVYISCILKTHLLPLITVNHNLASQEQCPLKIKRQFHINGLCWILTRVQGGRRKSLQQAWSHISYTWQGTGWEFTESKATFKNE